MRSIHAVVQDYNQDPTIERATRIIMEMSIDTRSTMHDIRNILSKKYNNEQV